METFETGKCNVAQNAYIYCLDQFCVLSEGITVISDYNINRNSISTKLQRRI